MRAKNLSESITRLLEDRWPVTDEPNFGWEFRDIKRQFFYYLHAQLVELRLPPKLVYTVYSNDRLNNYDKVLGDSIQLGGFFDFWKNKLNVGEMFFTFTFSKDLTLTAKSKTVIRNKENQILFSKELSLNLGKQSYFPYWGVFCNSMRDSIEKTISDRDIYQALIKYGS